MAQRHGKTLGSVRKEMALDLTRRLLEGPPYKGVQSRLADALGIRQSHLSKVLSGKSNIGNEFVAALAHLTETPLSAFFDDGTTTEIEVDERYPNRRKAVKAAKALDYPGEAIVPVQSAVLKSDHDPDPDWWFDQIRAEKRRLEMESASAPTSREPTSDEEHARQMAELRAKAQAESDAARERSEARKRARTSS